MLFKNMVSIFISSVIVLEPAFAYAGAQPLPQLPQMALAEKMNSEIDPIYQQFANSPEPHFKIVFDKNDPAIDKDPYFMRSQGWSEVDKKNNSLGYTKTAQGLQIHLEQSQKTLSLKLPFTPLQATTDFIFFSLDSTSDLFKKAAGPNQKTGEGLFFISRADIQLQAENELPVPVFFLPLPGQGWTQNLSSIEIAQADMLVVANKKESISIELRDIDSVMKAQKINLLVASVRASKNRNALTKEMYPAPGMTASFGLFFTGIDLQMPEKSVWPTSNETQSHFHFLFKTLLKTQASQYLFSSLFPKAYAFEMSQQLEDRLTYVGTALAGMLAVSFILKCAHPGVRKRLAEMRTEEPKTALGKLKMHSKETADVFAAMTSTAATFSTVTFANALELFLDKMAPATAAADHTLARRFLKNSFYYTRDALEQVPVNSRTFFLGAIVMGSVDTAMVHLQYQYAVPWIAEKASSFGTEQFQQRVKDSFDVNDPSYKHTSLEDTVRNGIAHTLNGASGYSVDKRGQIYDNVVADIESEMKTRGLNPKIPENKEERETLIKERLNVLMKQAGLPDDKEFLFDASTVFSNVSKALGYQAPEGMKNYQTSEGVNVQQSFMLEKRFGLSKNALEKSIKIAREWIRTDQSQTSRQALELLEETLRSMSFRHNWVNDGFTGLAKARQTRQQLTILSYDGPITYALKFLPDTWGKKYSAEAAQAAAIMFRQSLYSYLAAEGDDLLFANKKNSERYGVLAKQIALKEMLQEKTDLTEEKINASSELQFELKLRTQMTINNLARAQGLKEKAESFEPPKLDWLAKRQNDRALKEADVKIQAWLETAQGTDASDEKATEMKQKFYRNALARQIGLHIEDVDIAAAQGRQAYVEMMEFVEKSAAQGTQEEITKNQEMARYYEKISAPEQEKLKMFIYANKFLKAYSDAATVKEMVSPTDVAQPGRLQKLRQTQTVRKSPFLTRTLRSLEAFGNDQQIELGVKGALFRNLPLANDLFNSHKVLMKTILPMLSISYAWSFFVWQIHIPYAAWTLFVLSVAATIKTPSMLLNRFFRMHGMKPKGGVLSMVAYTLPYAWLTFMGMFPMMLYSGDLTILFSDAVRDPVMSILGKMGVKDWIIGALATGLLVKLIKKKEKPDFAGETKNIDQIFKTQGGLRCEALF